MAMSASSNVWSFGLFALILSAALAMMLAVQLTFAAPAVFGFGGVTPTYTANTPVLPAFISEVCNDFDEARMNSLMKENTEIFTECAYLRSLTSPHGGFMSKRSSPSSNEMLSDDLSEKPAMNLYRLASLMNREQRSNERTHQLVRFG